MEPIGAQRCRRVLAPIPRSFMRRLTVSLLTVALAALLVPAAAQAKGGVMFEPQLYTLVPGQPQEVRLFVGPAHGPDGELPQPPRGAVPVLVLRASTSDRMERFTGRPLGARRGSRMVVTLPRTRGAEVWKVSLRAAGRIYPALMDESVVTPADPAAPPDRSAAGGDSATAGAGTGPTDASDGGGGPPAWPFAGGAVLLALAAGGAMALRSAGRRNRDRAPRRIQPDS
jgi:hypothetical protein